MIDKVGQGVHLLDDIEEVMREHAGYEHCPAVVREKRDVSFRLVLIPEGCTHPG